MAAHETWGATCGPAALAAAVGMEVLPLRRFWKTRWTTPTTMKEALTGLGVAFAVHAALASHHQRGLLFIQLRGAWDCKPVKAQYPHTHWVAFARQTDGLSIYDGNAGSRTRWGGWFPSEEWKRTILQQIVASKKGASGGWWIRTVVEIALAACYRCGAKEEELERVGRSLYSCDARGCGHRCCSDCSESGPKGAVICLECEA